MVVVLLLASEQGRAGQLHAGAAAAAAAAACGREASTVSPIRARGRSPMGGEGLATGHDNNKGPSRLGIARTTAGAAAGEEGEERCGAGWPLPRALAASYVSPRLCGALVVYSLCCWRKSLVLMRAGGRVGA